MLFLGNFFGIFLALLFSVQRLQAQDPNNVPRFVKNQFIASFKEEQPIGSNVTQVSAIDDESNSILYEIGADGAGKFNINNATGWITSKVVIDRETAQDPSMTFTVYAYDDVNGPSAKTSALVTITIDDVNDNAPAFKKPSYQASVREDISPVREILTVTATDADISENSRVTYSIQDGNAGEKFYIGLYSGTVTVIKSLDYESVNNYTLRIIAKDSGPNNGLNSSTTLNIQIEDADDLPAKFSSSSYAAEVQENAAKGTYVTTVTARDGDKMLNAPVEYFIDADTNPRSAFTVLGNSGVITVNGSLDRETQNSYTLRIGATSTTHKAVFATVRIIVKDVNDNPPKFLDTPYIGAVLENASLGMTVMRVTAVDKDEGNNAVFSYSLERAGGKFTVTPAGYILINDKIDRETADVHSFQVVAKETRTSEQFQAVAAVTFNVTDLNDNNPRCSQAVYKTTVVENNAANTFVLQISVTDPDQGPNGVVRYSLVPDSNRHYNSFMLNSLNGTIYTNVSFDREKLGLYTITVRATDQPTSGQGRFGECTVQVTVGDDNDNSPKFSNLPNDTSVSEGASTNSAFFTVKAVDADEGVNAAVSYSISGGNTDGAFIIDTNSGKLSTARKIDRETATQFSLQITATDGKGKATKGNLLVRITDVNDNTPAFTEPGGYNFAVNEGRAGVTVGVVTAIDEDEGTNGEIAYSLKPVEDYMKFTIDSSTGEIKTAVALDRETINRQDIRILSRDKGSPYHQAEVRVVINITDINDHRPAFSQRHFFVEVKEQQPAHVILNLTVRTACPRVLTDQ